MFSLSQRAGVRARHAVEAAAREDPPRHPLRHRAEEDRRDRRRRTRRSSAPDQEGREVGFGGIARRIERYYRRYRQRGRGELEDGGVARQGDGRAHVPGLQGRAAPADAAAVHGRRPHHPRRRAAQLRRAADVSRHREAGRPRRGCRPSGAVRDPRAAEAAARHRPRLPQLQPPLRHALGRRVAAHPAVDADRLRADGDALRPRRAEHRAPSEGQHQDDRDAREPARHRQHRHRRRARRGHDSRRRSRRRDGAGPGRARRPRRGPGHARRRPEVQGVADGAVLLRQAVDRHADRRGARATASRSSCAARARTT